MKQEDKTLQTKIALGEALKRKMTKKPVSKITISELAEECNINRKTFYYHFEDIFALLTWVFEQEAIEVIKGFNMMLDLDDAILFVMNYITENKHILNCAIDSVGVEGLKQFLAADFQEVVGTNIDLAQSELQVSISDDFKQFLTTTYTEALAGLLINWIKARHKGEVSFITPEYIELFLRSSLHAVLTAAQKQSGN